MATQQSVLFSWDDVERLPELRRLEFVLEQLPDADLVAALESRRGRGRGEYPVRAMWRALVAGVVFGHASSASLLRELGRNPALLSVCGFDALGRQSAPRRTLARGADGTTTVVEEARSRRDGVPTAWAFSRFLANVVGLEEESGAVSGMVDALRGRLLAELPGYGTHLGYDGKAVPSHSTGRRDATTGATTDTDADWGSHETRGTDRNGKAWWKVKTWFGYGLHLIADTEHELPVWFEVTRASRSEVKVLDAGIDELFGAAPELAARCADFCADRGLDAGPLKRKLWDAHGVRPLIDVRELWREEKAMPDHDPSQPILRSLSADGGGNVLHSEKGVQQGVVPLSGDGRGAATGVPGLRGGPRHAEVPLPGGGVRARLRRSGAVPARRRVDGRGLWAGGAHRPGVRRPAHVHADAVGQPVVAARPPPPRRAGADQRAARQQLRVRAPLRARAGEDAGAAGTGAGGDDGAGARLGGGGPARAHALAGGSRTAAGGVAPPTRRSRPHRRRPGIARPPAAPKCEPFSLARPRTDSRRRLPEPPHPFRHRRRRFQSRARITRPRKNATAQLPPCGAVWTAHGGGAILDYPFRDFT